MSKAPKEAPKEAEAGEGGGKKKGNVVVLALVACNILSLGGLGAYVVLGGKGEHAAPAPEHAAAETEAGEPGAEASAEGEKKAEHGEAQEAPASEHAPPSAQHKSEKSDHREGGLLSTVVLGSFVINLNDSLHPAYLKASLTAEVSHPEVEAEVKGREPQIRDTVISYLSSLTLKETQGPVAKANIRDSLRQRLNNILSTGEVKQVYLTDFVTQ